MVIELDKPTMGLRLIAIFEAVKRNGITLNAVSPFDLKWVLKTWLLKRCSWADVTRESSQEFHEPNS